MFQFLIGSMEMRIHLFTTPTEIAFQFLIGSMEIKKIKNDSVGLHRFQFLIGSMEINTKNIVHQSKTRVSIPYR